MQIKREKPVHILLLTINLVMGGVSTCLIRLIDALLRTGKYRFTIVVRDNAVDELFSRWLAAHGVRVIVLDGFSIEKPKGWWQRHKWKWQRHVAMSRHRKIIKKICNDVDFLLDYFDGFMWKYVEGIDLPNAFWFHSGTAEIERLIIPVKEKLFSVYSSMICLTDAFKHKIISMMPELAYRVEHVYNVINIEKIRELSTYAQAPCESKYFVVIGRLSDDKDHITVIRAFKKFSLKNPDGVMYIIGDGPFRKKIELEVASLGLKANVRFVGMMENPYGYLKGAIANVLSSPGEGMSAVLVEAMSLGVLNIASDCPDGPRELLMDGAAGMLFPPGDDEMLSEMMNKVWNSKEDFDEMIFRAQESLSRFTESEIVAKIDKIIGG
jgi:glycosyltransferase involved in cell wall biosynthesis